MRIITKIGDVTPTLIIMDADPLKNVACTPIRGAATSPAGILLILRLEVPVEILVVLVPGIHWRLKFICIKLHQPSVFCFSCVLN